MIKIDAISPHEKNLNAIIEIQNIRRIELMEQSRKGEQKVNENKQADTSEKYGREKDIGEQKKQKKTENNNPYLREVELQQSKKLKFVVNKETDRVIIQVVNPKTGEVIKEIPPEEMLKKMANICKKDNIIIDEKV